MPSSTLNENAKAHAGWVAILVSGAGVITAILARPDPAPPSPTVQQMQYNGVTFEAMVRSFDEMRGALTALTATVTTSAQNITKEIQDGQRRMDRFQYDLDSVKAQLSAHARYIENDRAGKPPIKPDP